VADADAADDPDDDGLAPDDPADAALAGVTG
jgi:hypothetical protein